MAPKRRRSEVEKLAEGEVKPTVEVPPLRRVTRSLTQEDAVPPPRQPPKKRARKAKTTPKKPKKTTKEKEDDDDNSASAEKETDDESDGGLTSVAEFSAAGGGSSFGSGSKTTTVVIEHCKQCKSIGKRAKEAQAGLKESFPGINVLINPEKPRKGCFEIRMEGETGETFISLLNMKRPFKPLKDLDMEEAVADIIKKIKG